VPKYFVVAAITIIEAVRWKKAGVEVLNVSSEPLWAK
jgi:hypothetical protein